MERAARHGWAKSPDALNRGDIQWAPTVGHAIDIAGPDPVEVLEDGRARWYRRPGQEWETKRPRPTQDALMFETSQGGLF